MFSLAASPAIFDRGRKVNFAAKRCSGGSGNMLWFRPSRSCQKMQVSRALARSSHVIVLAHLDDYQMLPHVQPGFQTRKIRPLFDHACDTWEKRDPLALCAPILTSAIVYT
jgi:hypothetical protein